MEMPSLLPEEMRAACAAYEEELELFHGLRIELPALCRFLVAAINDEGWSERHPLFMEKALLVISRRWFRDRLPKRAGDRLCTELRDHIEAMRRLLVEDLRLIYRGEAGSVRKSVNSLLFTIDSPYFLELVQHESAGQNIKQLLLRDPLLKASFVEDYLRFCYGDRLAHLNYASEEQLLPFMRMAHYIGCKPLEERAADSYMRYVGRDNLIDVLLLAYREKLSFLLNNCFHYGNELVLGYHFATGKGSAEQIDVTFENFDMATQRAFEPLCSYVTALHFPPELVPEEPFVSYMESCSSLRFLEVSGMTKWHAHLGALPLTLEGLDLSDSPWLDDEEMASLAEQCPQLTRLVLSGNRQLSYVAWHKLVELSGLEELALARCDQLRDEELQLILQCVPDLTSLDLSGSPQLTEQGLMEIARWAPQLRSLNLTDCPGVGDDLVGELLYRCRRLQELELSGCDQLTYRGLLRSVKKGNQLKRLVLARSRLTPQQTKEISRLSYELRVITD